MKKLHRVPKKKSEHVLARIKNDLKLSQAEVSEGLGISLNTFKNIVHHKTKKWNKHAQKVSLATGVALKSLLANNPRKPLLATNGKRWTAQEYKAGIAVRYLGDIVQERSRGRHTLQWFRIVMIKVGRCMLAAYRDKKSGDAFVKLLRAIGEVGKSFPSYTTKVPYIEPGKPVHHWVLPGKGSIPFTEICQSEMWDWNLQSAVGGIPSRSRKGIKKIFGSFVKEILAEEKLQIHGSESNLITAEKKAREIQKTTVKPTKPTRR